MNTQDFNLAQFIIKKKIGKKLISVVLVLMTFFTAMPASALASESETEQTNGYELTLEWNKAGATDTLTSSSSSYEYQYPSLIVNYKKTKADGSIKAGDIEIQVPGIRNTNNNETGFDRQKDGDAVTIDINGVGADTEKNGENNNYAFYYTYDDKNDMFTFKNKNDINNQMFSGRFEIRFKVKPRATAHEYKKEIKATMNVKLSDGTEVDQIISNALNYEQKRTKDTYEIKEYTGTSLIYKDGLGTYLNAIKSAADISSNDEAGNTEIYIENYCWVKYYLSGKLTEYARGIQKAEEFYFYMPRDAIVIYNDENKIKVLTPVDWVEPEKDPKNPNFNEENYYCYRITKDIFGNTPGDYFNNNILVAYPKKAETAYGDIETSNITEYKKIISYVQLRGTYYEEDKNVVLASAKDEAELIPFDSVKASSVPAENTFEKAAYGHEGKIKEVDLHNFRSEYSSSFSINTATPKEGNNTVTVIDEEMTIKSSGTDGKLQSDDYTFTGVYIPSLNEIKNANGLTVGSGSTDFDNVDIKISVKNGENNWEVIKTCNYKDVCGKRITFSNKNSGVKIEISNLSTGFKTDKLRVFYKFNIQTAEILKDIYTKSYVNHSKILLNSEEHIIPSNSLSIARAINTVGVSYSASKFSLRDETSENYYFTCNLPYEFNIQDGLGTNKITCAFIVPENMQLECDDMESFFLGNDVKYTLNGKEKSELQRYVTNVQSGTLQKSDGTDYTYSDGTPCTYVSLTFDFGDEYKSNISSLGISGIPMYAAKDRLNLKRENVIFTMPLMIAVDTPNGSVWTPVGENASNWPGESIEPLTSKIFKNGTNSLCIAYTSVNASLRTVISEHLTCRKSVASPLTNGAFTSVASKEGEYTDPSKIPEVYQNSKYTYKVNMDIEANKGYKNIGIFDSIESYTSKDITQKWRGEFSGIDCSKALSVLKKPATDDEGNPKYDENDNQLFEKVTNADVTVYYSDKSFEEGYDEKGYNINSELTVKLNDKNLPEVYYNETGDLYKENYFGWKTAEEWGKDVSGAKSVYVYFNDLLYITTGKDEENLYIQIKMTSPTVDSTSNSDESVTQSGAQFGSITENKSYVFAKYINDSGENISLASAPTPLKLVNYKGSLTIIKTDADATSDEPLQGAEFEVKVKEKDENGNDVYEFFDKVTTNGSGRATIEGLTIGKTYTITETTAPKGYQKYEKTIKFTYNESDSYSVEDTENKEEKTRTITVNDTIDKSKSSVFKHELEIEDERKPGVINLTKYAYSRNYTYASGETCTYDKDKEDKSNYTDGVTLEGAQFALYTVKTKDGKKACGERVCDPKGNEITATTDENGKLTINGLEWGEYCLREITPPDGYNSGSKLTQANNDYYTIDGEYIFFTINAETAENTMTVNYTNQQIPATVTLNKREMLEDGSIDENGGAPLEGVEFDLYYSTSGDANTYSLIANGTTDANNGQITFEGLPYGYYYAKEQNMPSCYEAPGKNGSVVKNVEVVDEKPRFYFDLFPNEGVSESNPLKVDVTVYNKRRYGQARFVKSDAGYTEGDSVSGIVSGAPYVLCKAIEANKKPDDYISVGKSDDGKYDYCRVTPDGEFLKKGFTEKKETTYFVTDNGEGAFVINGLCWGTYYLKECEVTDGDTTIGIPSGYKKNEAFVEFTVDAESFEGTGQIAIEYGKNYNDACDYRYTGSLTLTKVDEEDGKPITNNSATFRLFKDGVSYGDEEYTTDENGVIKISDLPWGAYEIKEIKAPAGYNISKETYKFTINGNTTAATTKFKNEKKTAEITINKTLRASDIVYAHGNPVFNFNVNSTDGTISKSASIEFIESLVKNNIKDGMVTLSTTVSVVAGKEYTVTEASTNRYSLSKISYSTDKDDEKVILVTDDNRKNCCATLDLSIPVGMDNVDGYVNFVNDKISQSGTSDSGLVVNEFRNQNLISISAEWTGTYYCSAVITEGDLEKLNVVAYYDGGGTKVLNKKVSEDDDGFELLDQNKQAVTVFDSSPGTMTFYVSYNGLETQVSVNLIEDKGNFTWQVIKEAENGKNGTARITGYTGSSTNIKIPSTVTGVRTWNETTQDANTLTGSDEYTVTEIGYVDSEGNYKQFRLGLKLQTYLGKNTFSISLPDTVTTICENAFCYDTSDNSGALYSQLRCLQPQTENEAVFKKNITDRNLVIPNTVTSIGAAAFMNCVGFEGQLTLPTTTKKDENVNTVKDEDGNDIKVSTLTTIEDNVFNGCYKLGNNGGKLDLPDGIEKIGNYAFAYCRGFGGELKFPNSVTTIGDGAFRGYYDKDDPNKTNENQTRFTGLTLPNNDKGVTIGDYAFWYCYLGESGITIPKNVTSIGAYAFSYNDGITGNNQALSVKCFSKDGKYDGYRTKGELTFAKGSILTTIGDYAFNGNINLTGELKLPNGISNGKNTVDKHSSYGYYCEGGIGILAFFHTGFKSITLPDNENFKCINYFCFSHCTDLVSIEIPNKCDIQAIAVGAFCNSSKFQGNVKLSSEEIYNRAVDGYGTSDNKVEPIAYYTDNGTRTCLSVSAFDELSNDEKNKDIYYLCYKGHADSEGYYTYNTILKIPDSVEYICYKAFSGTSVHEVTLGKNIQLIDSMAFIVREGALRRINFACVKDFKIVDYSDGNKNYVNPYTGKDGKKHYEQIYYYNYNPDYTAYGKGVYTCQLKVTYDESVFSSVNEDTAGNLTATIKQVSFASEAFYNAYRFFGEIIKGQYTDTDGVKSPIEIEHAVIFPPISSGTTEVFHNFNGNYTFEFFSDNPVSNKNKINWYSSNK